MSLVLSHTLLPPFITYFHLFLSNVFLTV